MRGSTTSARVVPRGVGFAALRAMAVLVDGDPYDLFAELWLARREMQRVIDALWELGSLPRRSQVHQMFYRVLRAKGYRAHNACQIYRYAYSAVAAARASGGGKPVLRRLSMRFDMYDASIDFGSWVVTVKLRDKVFKLRLLHRRSYLDKFRGRKWYEVIVKWLPSARIEVVIPFRFEYQPYGPRGVVSIDVNLRVLTLYDGRRVRRVKTMFPEALRLKHLAEAVQRRHSYAWRRSRKWLGIIKALHRRGRNIVIDWNRKIAKYIVLRAMRDRYAVALENLRSMWFNASKRSHSLADRLSRFAYRKLQLAIMTKAIEYNVPLIFVNPRGTSTTCPRCGAKLVYNHRLAVCPRCGFAADRDTVGATNIYLRAVHALPRASGRGAPAR